MEVGWETLIGLPRKIDPKAEECYLEAVLKDLGRVGQMFKYYDKKLVDFFQFYRYSLQG